MHPNATQEDRVDTDLNPLATALYAGTNNLLKGHPEHTPAHPAAVLARGSLRRNCSSWWCSKPWAAASAKHPGRTTPVSTHHAELTCPYPPPS